MIRFILILCCALSGVARADGIASVVNGSVATLQALMTTGGMAEVGGEARSLKSKLQFYFDDARPWEARLLRDSEYIYAEVPVLQARELAPECVAVRQAHERSLWAMEQLHGWLDQLLFLVDLDPSPEEQVNHALLKIRELSEIVADAYPGEYDQATLPVTFMWAVKLPRVNPTFPLHLIHGNRKDYWITRVTTQKLFWGGLEWNLDNFPFDYSAEPDRGLVKIVIPLSLTHLCLESRPITVSGHITAVSEYSMLVPGLLNLRQDYRDGGRAYDFTLALRPLAGS